MSTASRSFFTVPLPQSARALALSVLVNSAKSGEGVDVLMDRALTSSLLDRRDCALTVELVYGVLRRQGTIDWRLKPVLDKPMHRLPVVVQMVIRLAVYQLLYLDRIPQSAAVNESVRLAKTYSRVLTRDWGGFVNAVLRAFIREPFQPWPSFETHPSIALSLRCSVPEWLSRRWIDRLGLATAEAACRQASSVPPVTLRVNRLKTTRNAFLARLNQAGVRAVATAVSPVGIFVEESGPIPSLPGFEEGTFYVEDEGAQLITPLLDVRPGESILDACAAPGGKTTHLAELMDDRGTIYAVDRQDTRLQLLRQNCIRLGCRSVVPIVGDARHHRDWRPAVGSQEHDSPPIASMFDRVLVDAPCSGLGVLRRHPEAKWWKDSASLPRHQALQLQILDSVALSLRPGGVLVYSTCSTEPDENEAVIERFLRAHADFRRESVAPWLPAAARDFLTPQGDFMTEGNRFSMDVFYAARLRKRT